MEWQILICSTCSSQEDVGVIKIGKYTSRLCWNCYQEVMNPERWKTCQDCGIKSELVHESYDPYESDVHGLDIPCTLCENCYHERSMDV